jgi:VWFA-related protein
MMRRLLTCLLPSASFLLVAAAVAQTGANTPATPAQTPQTATVPMLHANSRLVVVDVVVTDTGNGKAVRNLKESDFTLLEKGQPQTISHFEEHSADPGVQSKLPPMPKLEPGVFTNYSPAPVEGALNILLLDSLNTPMQDQGFVRDQILKYLKTARPGTRMAIFGLNQRLHLLQGFTTDPELLRSVVEGKKNLAKASPLMDNPVSGDTVGQQMMSDTLSDMLGNSPGAASIVANMQQFEAQQQAFQLTLRIEYTLDALNVLGRYLSGLPGRKNLIWFSGSFPIDILPDGDLQDPFANVASFEDEFRETTDILSRSQVAVYPIDARGLMVSPMLSAANSGSKYARSPTAFGKDQAKFFNQTAGEHSTMMVMAEQTGGKAFVNTNGLKEAVDKAVDAGSNYYTLTYTPTNKDWKGDFRKIQVQLPQKGYTLAYRCGYYADDPDAPPKRGSAQLTPATGTVNFNPMAVAMMWGAPDPTEIIFSASVLPKSADPEPGLLDGVHAEPKVTGPYRTYVIAYGARGRDISASPTSNAGRHLHLEFVTNVYSADGALVTSTGKQISGDLDEARYNALLKGGLQFRQQISVPVKGEYFLRIGIHDMSSDHVGAVEIPVDKVAKLTPLSAISAPAASPATPSPAKP